MSSAPLDLVGKVGDPTTQGLGRLIGQYTGSTNLIALLQGTYLMGQDLDLLFQRLSRLMNPNDDVNYGPPTYPANTRGAGQSNDMGYTAYNAGTAYPVRSLVSYNAKSYECIQATTAGTVPTNTSYWVDVGPDGYVNVQLDIIGAVVGISRTLPNLHLATNKLYLALIRAKIYRNHVKGGTIQQLIDQVLRIFAATTALSDVVVQELGHMTVLVMIGRQLTADESSIFDIPCGVNFIKASILPRPTGVRLLLAWQDSGCFCFSDESNAGVPLLVDGVGFNTTENATTGHWAGDFGS